MNTKSLFKLYDKKYRLHKKNLFIIYGVLIVTLYMIPYVLFGEESYITIHDFLDLTVGHLKAIIDNNSFFKTNDTIQIMNGIQRGLIPFTSMFEIKSLLFFIFKPYTAILINTFLIKILAFIGVYLLSYDYIIDCPKKERLSFLLGIIFFTIPFYIDYGLSSSGIPLLIYAVLNLKNGIKIISSLVLIILFGLYSSFVLSGLFVCISYLLFIVILLYKKNYNGLYFLFLGLFILSLVYTITNYNLITSFFYQNAETTNRLERISNQSLSDTLKNFLYITIQSQYHVGNFFTGLILIVFLIIARFEVVRKDIKYRFVWFSILYVLGFTLLLSLITLFLSDKINVLKQFQFNRFYFLYPGICIIALGYVTNFLFKKKSFFKIALLSLSIILFSFISNQEYIYFVKKTFNFKTENPNFKQFYDTTLFSQIKNENPDINNSKIICLGIFPSVLEYNGFETLDSYLSQYSLKYKHDFRKIMEDELSKDDDIRQYFDNWGNRCYIFSSELGKNYLFGKSSNKNVIDLSLNAEAAKYMKCRYIVSAVDINNHKEIGLEFVSTYTRSDSFWSIKLYRFKYDTYEKI